MQHLSQSSGRHPPLSKFSGCQEVRFFALHRIKPLCSTACAGPPDQFHLSFNLAAVLPRRSVNALAPEATVRAITSNRHRLQRDYQGYLIPFASHAFAPERQSLSGAAFATGIPPHLSTHFTATHGILPPYKTLLTSFRCNSRLSPISTSDQSTACVRFTPSNSD